MNKSGEHINRQVTTGYCNDDFICNVISVKINNRFDGFNILKYDYNTHKLYWYYENTLRGKAERIDAPKKLSIIFNKHIGAKSSIPNAC